MARFQDLIRPRAQPDIASLHAQGLQIGMQAERGNIRTGRLREQALRLLADLQRRRRPMPTPEITAILDRFIDPAQEVDGPDYLALWGFDPKLAQEASGIRNKRISQDKEDDRAQPGVSPARAAQMLSIQSERDPIKKQELIKDFVEELGTSQEAFPTGALQTLMTELGNTEQEELQRLRLEQRRELNAAKLLQIAEQRAAGGFKDFKDFRKEVDETVVDMVKEEGELKADPKVVETALRLTQIAWDEHKRLGTPPMPILLQLMEDHGILPEGKRRFGFFGDLSDRDKILLQLRERQETGQNQPTPRPGLIGRPDVPESPAPGTAAAVPRESEERGVGAGDQQSIVTSFLDAHEGDKFTRADAERLVARLKEAGFTPDADLIKRLLQERQ